MIDINEELIEYRSHLLHERKLSTNTIEAYMRDITGFVESLDRAIETVELVDIESYISTLHDINLSRASRARIVSGIKSFFNYLYTYEKISKLPTELIASPKLQRKLPSYLNEKEIDLIISSIDLSQPLAHRNRAIIEVLYGCGLRVSELVGLRMTDLFFDSGYIKVIGKGDKERLVPIGDHVIKAVNLWREERKELKISTKSRQYLFLNRRGNVISRVMVFNIIKQIAHDAGITKEVSPHSFRHTYASLLIKGGADIRAVQQILGHQSILTTEIYTHIDSSQKRESINKLFPETENEE